MITSALRQVSQRTVGPAEQFLEAGVGQVRRERPGVVGVVRGRRLPGDLAWAGSSMQQSQPPSQTGSGLLASQGRGQDPRGLQEAAPVREQLDKALCGACHTHT